MKKMVLIIFPVIILLSACALEIANVIGPGGGWVYYDKGNYKDGWRYKECSPFDVGELKITDLTDSGYSGLKKAVKLCLDQSDDWYAYDWEIPDEADMKKMLECFSYGFTRWSPDYYYLSVNGQPESSKGKPKYDLSDSAFVTGIGSWNVVILHKNFDNKLNGEPEIVTMDKFPKSKVIRIRPIRKF